MDFIKTGGRHETVEVQGLAFSPDGKTLLYTLWSQIWKYDVASGRQSVLTQDEYLWGLGSYGNEIVFAPNAETFALRSVSHPENGVITPSYGLSIWNLAGAEIFSLATGLPNAEAIRNVSYSPDGELLAAASFDNAIWLWNPRDGKLIQKLTGHSSDVYDVAFHPNNKILASVRAVRFCVT